MIRQFHITPYGELFVSRYRCLFGLSGYVD